MSSFKTITENEKIDETTSNNIRPEFNELMQLEKRTENSFRYKSFSFIGSIKELKKKLKAEEAKQKYFGESAYKNNN